ncbi:MAG: YkgJ family cysteine cluster protein [Verrucomicrobiae bacterium]|nr:YkgJ family cysteine cluster protein [Verrucomicrobiae bacterium]
MSRSRKPARPSADPGDLDRAMREVRAVYADLAERPIERDCRGRTECCRFRLTGRTPQLTRGEALVAASGWRAAGRKSVPTAEAADGACPFLGETGLCQIYRDRPFGCRTHFCAAAGGMMDRTGIIDLIRRLEAVDETLDGDGPKPLRNAIGEVWEAVSRRRRR